MWLWRRSSPHSLKAPWGPATKAKAAKKLGYTDDFGNLNEWDGFTDDEYWMMTTDDDEYLDDE